jgi:predicted alpha/beta hydrolase family esterase
LVAGPISSVGLYEIENFFEKKFDFKKIKQAAKKIVLIYSDNDTLVPKSHGEELQEKLGGKLYLIPRGNHLCEGDGFFRFPIVLKEILKIE